MLALRGCLSWRLRRRPHLYLPVQARAFLRHQPWQRRSSALEATRSQTPSPRRLRGRRKAHKQSRTLRGRRRLHGRAFLRVRKQRLHHLLFLCRRADVGIPTVELSVLRFHGLLDLHGPNPVQSPRAACHHVEMCFLPRSTRGRAHKSAQAILHCGWMRKRIGRASVFSAQIQSLNWAITFVFAQLRWQRSTAILLRRLIVQMRQLQFACVTKNIFTSLTWPSSRPQSYQSPRYKHQGTYFSEHQELC